jgi:hypothetical protein
MTLVRTLSSIAALAVVTLATSAWAATDDQHVGHHPSSTAAVQLAQATPGSPGMGMGGKSITPAYADQMKAMQEMHNKVMAAKTPEERNALMAEQMQLMQNGMNMMGGMGGMGGAGAGAMMGKPADVAARQGMMEQRMDMMQSMMQMMMDRMQSVPATK